MNSQLRKNLVFNTAGSLLFYVCQAAMNLLVTALAGAAANGLLATAIAAIARYVHRGWFFLLGGSCIALGCSTMLLELFLSITFHTRMFVWSLYPLATLSSMGLFWILAGIIRPLGNALRKRMFV